MSSSPLCDDDSSSRHMVRKGYAARAFKGWHGRSAIFLFLLSKPALVLNRLGAQNPFVLRPLGVLDSLGSLLELLLLNLGAGLRGYHLHE